ncbi:unnamed protein product [Parnassius mnemosyne]|uniref:Uncharacterized protein n=1 Tax=Parnassius mnemosyne TaxID=213953 RepID=A0AAV1KZM2_9NEOP
MPIIRSRGCWRRLRLLCYASAFYAMVYFSINIVTMERSIEAHERYRSGKMKETESEIFLVPDELIPIAVSLNITMLICSSLGFVACVILVIGVYKDIKYMLLPWIIAMGLEILGEVINFVFLFYLRIVNFNSKTSYLFTLEFFFTSLNIYAMLCVISQFQEYLEGRGTAAFDYSDRVSHQHCC